MSSQSPSISTDAMNTNAPKKENSEISRKSLSIIMSHTVSMTKSEIVQAAHMAFESTKPMGVTPSVILRKRTVSNDKENDDVVMPSYNSEFLSGIFADIASADSTSSTTASHTNLTDSVSSTENSTSHGPPLPAFKKSKISKTKSITRNRRSFQNMTFLVSPFDPKQKQNDLSLEKFIPEQSRTINENSKPTIQNATESFCKLAFPHLPATVSDQDLTRNNLPSRQNTETYGWFVEMDNKTEEHETNAYRASEEITGSKNLAFSGVTSPVKKSEMQAEVEWAKAADTIDDVLGNFF